MKRCFAILTLLAALILPGLAQAKDAQPSMIDEVVRRGVLRVGFSSFVPWAMQDKNGDLGRGPVCGEGDSFRNGKSCPGSARPACGEGDAAREVLKGG